MSKTEPINLVIKNRIYDVTKFARFHPGGEQILKDFNDCDSTDYFYAIHSKDAIKQLKNMKSTEVEDKDKIPESKIAKLSKQLEKEGWMKADWKLEMTQMIHTLVAHLMATYLAYSYPFWAALFLCFGTLNGGWVGHMNDHQRDNCLRKVNNYYTTVL
mmetsp:Transcript_10262/g.8813  ORF Transcript_10262/g.8813 Transcript_10262/m.8813 type:complete len:158 (-) Transcript_10262:799-1272(-)